MSTMRTFAGFLGREAALLILGHFGCFLVDICVAIFILKMEENTQHFQDTMLYYFKKGKNTTEMQINICAVYGEGAVTG